MTSVESIMARNMSENDLLCSVIDAAKHFGWTVYHARPAMTRSGRWSTPTQGDNGFPDICMCRKGRVIFAELKSERGRVSVEQQNWLEELEGLPATPGNTVSVHLWRPTHWISGLIEGELR